MYALSHPEIIDEIIKARNRGVKVLVFLDQGMTNGSCKKMITTLKSEGISIRTRLKSGLNHHKAALIDDTYIFGSVNWSKAGFTKNEETLIILHKLSPHLSRQIFRFIFNLNYYSNKF